MSEEDLVKQKLSAIVKREKKNQKLRLRNNQSGMVVYLIKELEKMEKLLCAYRTVAQEYSGLLEQTQNLPKILPEELLEGPVVLLAPEVIGPQCGIPYGSMEFFKHDSPADMKSTDSVAVDMHEIRIPQGLSTSPLQFVIEAAEKITQEPAVISSVISKETWMKELLRPKVDQDNETGFLGTVLLLKLRESVVWTAPK